MTVIHMETEVVRAAAQKLDWAAGELYFKPNRLRGNANTLRNAWVGGRSAAYAAEMQRLANVLHAEVINLQRLATRVRNEVDEWEVVDNDATFLRMGSNAFISNLGTEDTTHGFGKSPGHMSLAPNRARFPDKDLNLDFFFEFGMNTFEAWAEGYKELEPLLVSLWFKPVVATISIALKTLSDHSEGDDLAKNIHNATLEQGAETLFGPHLMIPVLVYQKLFELEANRLEELGYYQEAEETRYAGEFWNLPGYVADLMHELTKSGGRGTYDPENLPGSSKLVERFSKRIFVRGGRGAYSGNHQMFRYGGR